MDRSEIRALVDEVVALRDSARNLALEERRAVATFQGPRPRRPGESSYTAFLGPSVWARKFGFSLRDYYLRPDVRLYYDLKIALFRFNEIQDDTPLPRGLGVFLGAGFDSSVFGGEQVYSDDVDPWVSRDPVIAEPSDLRRLRMPDFHTSGMMPLAHRFYGELGDLAGDAFRIVMPDITRGPFGLAWHIRGFDQLMLDLYDAPAFARDLLEFVTESRMHFSTARATWLGEPLKPGMLGNDEVNIPSISPAIYRDFILPRERDLAAFHGGIDYWHCCGDIVPLLLMIRELRPRVQHISPYNDFPVAVDRAAGSVLEIWMHPAEDVVLATEEEMAAALRRKVNVCEEKGVAGFTVTTGHVQVMRDPEHTIEQAKRWVRAARLVEEETGRSPAAA
jgi:hypothetical protein